MRTIYTYDVCKKEAQLYDNAKDFRIKSENHYSASCRNGWLKDFTWLYKSKKQYVPDGYWDIFENVEKAANECVTKKEFHIKYSGAYTSAKKKGWLEKLHFEDGNKINADRRRIWTYEKCYETARNYKYKSDFEKEQPSAYNIARRNGWLETYDWFEVKPDPYRVNMHNIYVYEFAETKSAYIGLTINLTKRDYSHRNKKESSVFKHAKKNNIEIPTPKILEEGVSKDNSGEREHFYVEKYKADGWNILNRAKTGKTSSSKGSVDKKWSYNRVCAVASKYETLQDFYIAEPVAYVKAIEKGWEFDWLSKKKQANGYWNDKEKCHKAALECSSPREFCVKYGAAYEWSRKNGWIDEWFPNKRRSWNYEKCREFASTCETRKKFQKLYSQGYKLSVKNGWINEFYPKAA